MKTVKELIKEHKSNLKSDNSSELSSLAQTQILSFLQNYL